jgi:acetyl-CoA carboxylase carboxyltransferase component
VGRDDFRAAERGTLDDVIMPNATRQRTAGKFTQSAQ